MKTYLTLFLSLIIGFAVTAQDKLVTIYSDNCSHCLDLLNIIYKNSEVKKKLSNYELVILKSTSKEAKAYIEDYNIKKFPTQIAFYDYGMTVFGGHLSTQQELKFLQNPEDFMEPIDTLKVERKLKPSDSLPKEKKNL
ncbi:hypothetical protein N9I20_00625 [Flavobacteriaceae bacterium]|nr:hypothetical protein [Flavobacteriaceae bacterium]MDB4187602.1 hypothetical protein [Flavobacteriaceae bacterium]